jgi:hypothetical protein
VVLAHHLGRRRDLITNELIDDIGKFDPAKVAAEAKGYKVK